MVASLIVVIIIAAIAMHIRSKRSLQTFDDDPPRSSFTYNRAAVAGTLRPDDGGMYNNGAAVHAYEAPSSAAVAVYDNEQDMVMNEPMYDAATMEDDDAANNAAAM